MQHAQKQNIKVAYCKKHSNKFGIEHYHMYGVLHIFQYDEALLVRESKFNHTMSRRHGWAWEVIERSYQKIVPQTSMINSNTPYYQTRHLLLPFLPTSILNDVGLILPQNFVGTSCSRVSTQTPFIMIQVDDHGWILRCTQGHQYLGIYTIGFCSWSNYFKPTSSKFSTMFYACMHNELGDEEDREDILIWSRRGRREEEAKINDCIP